MITTLSRRNYFLLSPFADSFIASMQHSYAAGLDETDKLDRKVLQERFDHRQPFVQPAMAIDGHCVIALPATSKREYNIRLPIQLTELLTRLHCTQVSLLDFINTDFARFPFENFSKRNRFRRLTAHMERDLVARFAPSLLNEMLPLFLFSGCYDVPVIFIISDGPVPLSLRLCDDGNFHFNFLETDRSRILEAAELSGFATGSIELCDAYSVAFLQGG
jgi:hypothetical protein